MRQKQWHDCKNGHPQKSFLKFPGFLRWISFFLYLLFDKLSNKGKIHLLSSGTCLPILFGNCFICNSFNIRSQKYLRKVVLPSLNWHFFLFLFFLRCKCSESEVFVILNILAEFPKCIHLLNQVDGGLAVIQIPSLGSLTGNPFHTIFSDPATFLQHQQSFYFSISSFVFFLLKKIDDSYQQAGLMINLPMLCSSMYVHPIKESSLQKRPVDTELVQIRSCRTMNLGDDKSFFSLTRIILKMFSLGAPLLTQPAWHSATLAWVCAQRACVTSLGWHWILAHSQVPLGPTQPLGQSQHQQNSAATILNRSKFSFYFLNVLNCSIYPISFKWTILIQSWKILILRFRQTKSRLVSWPKNFGTSPGRHMSTKTKRRPPNNNNSLI
ncbi:hypothetical protein VP01_321g2 [Puccinia sorghi]|uniref:Uncharacterized protein n=1 Tax=Puccinia sorghi TaxID=27349 RepID=A0A0L6V060_9BASI|nr:hypothetical protein VP01_321g2 [Puccinia sorghi]